MFTQTVSIFHTILKTSKEFVIQEEQQVQEPLLEKVTETIRETF